MKKVFEYDFRGRKIIVENGEVAKQAHGAVVVRYGDTVILSTVVVGNNANILSDFFPLMVLYQEKLYSVGKIPGGFIKREGRPTDAATLAARMIDRPMRPMFPEDFRNEVQIVNTVLSVDTDNSPELTAMFGSSLCTCISKIPFDGPIAGVKVGRINGKFIINPTPSELEESDIDLTVAGTKKAINMVEAGSKEVLELHGSVLRNYCTRCGKFYSLEDLVPEGVPKCECGGTIKPDVVLYEEGLDSHTLNKAVQYIQQADMLIIGGTSLAVYPAAGLIDYYSGHKLVLINRDETPRDNMADLVLHESIGQVLAPFTTE